MAVSNIPIVIGDGTVTITDDGTVGTHTVTFENGDFSGGHRIHDRRVIYDRDTVASVRKGKRPVPGGSFTVHAREFTNGSAACIIDIAEFDGAWSGAGATKDVVTGDFNFVTLKFTAGKAALGDSADATLEYEDCILLWDFAEGEPAGTITVTWESYGEINRTGQS